MTINKILCIGSACEGLFMTKKLGLRYKGPVDNLGLKGFKYVYKLFNNEFYKNVISDEYYLEPINVWEFSKWPVTFFGNNKKFETADTYFMMHNDYRLPKTKNELIERFKLYYKYIDEAANNPELFFIYSIIYEDANLTDDIIISTLNKLPDFVKNKLLILNCGRFTQKCKLEDYYPIFYDNVKDTDDLYLRNKFNEWWLKNKYFYEKRNSQKYEKIIYTD